MFAIVDSKLLQTCREHVIKKYINVWNFHLPKSKWGQMSHPQPKLFRLIKQLIRGLFVK